MSGRGSGRIVAVLLALATLAVLAWHGRALQFFCDDSYISYRYSQNFAEGRGLVYNAGEYVEGYTNFLWVILVGLGMKAGFAAEPVSLWLGVLFLLVTIGGTALLARRLFASDAFAVVPALLLVLQGPMVLWSVSGLEASCFAAMTILAVLAYERGFASSPGSWKVQLLAGALYGVSTMVRPDGVVFGAAAGLHLLLAGALARPLAIRSIVVRASALAGGFLAVFVPFVAWRFTYYGDWLPNTFYVKAGGLLNVKLGFDYFLAWLGAYPLAGALTLGGVVLTLVLPRWREQRRTFGHLALALLLFSGYLVWAGGDYMALFRFMVPLLPIAMLFATALLVTLFEASLRLRIPAPAAATAGLLLLAAGGYWLWLPTRASLEGQKVIASMTTVSTMKTNSAQWAALGRTLKQTLPPETTIATTAAGALPFFAGMTTLDQSGLCDRHTAKVESDPWMLDRPGHMKQATRARISELKPDLVFWHPQIWPAGGTQPFPIAPTPQYELRAFGVPELAEKGLCAYVWVHQDALPKLAPRGLVPAKESGSLASKPANGGDRSGRAAPRRDREAEEIAAEIAALEAEPPPEPPTVDPPAPAPYDGPVFSLERIHAADPAAAEPRFSIGDVTRPLWVGKGSAEIEVTGFAGSFLELEIASAPVTREEGDRVVLVEPAGAHAPKRVSITLERDGAARELPVQSIETPFAGELRWRTLRADLSGVPAGRATFVVRADGDPVGQGSKWLATVPRLGQEPDAARPNVLIITIDTLRADHLGCYGHDRPTSPNLDALAKQGVLFERNLSQASWTLPSYSSVFSSRYVESHGVVHRDHPFVPGFVTFLELLAQAGYSTAGFVSGSFTDSFWGFDQGFDAYDDLGMVIDESHGGKARTSEGSDAIGAEGMKAATERRITSPEIANKAIAWLDAHRDRRFALFLHFFDPHEAYVKHPGISEQFPPRPPPDGFPNAVDPRAEVTARMRSLYEGEIAYTDRHVGRVLARLEQLGLADDTIVVVFADHGEAFQEHVLDPTNWKRNHGHGSSLFNEQVHVPLIFRVPGIEPGRVKTTVGNIDLGPTLLDLCGVEATEEKGWAAQGFSLRPLLESKEGSRGSEPQVLAAHFAMTPGPELVQVLHRIDQDPWTAIEWEPYRGRQGLQLLFRSDDRWQDYADNLLDRERGEFERYRVFYERKREDLESKRPEASALDQDASVIETLRILGYTD